MDALSEALAALPGGKRLPRGVYVHVELLALAPGALQVLVENARAKAGAPADAFNVVRISTMGASVSLLSYPDFFSHPFPTLAASWAVDFVTGRVDVRTYAERDNPPVLHRKETLLAAHDSRRTSFGELTRELERRGAYAQSRLIGTKRAWDRRLRDLGIEIEGHRVVGGHPSDMARSSTTVKRHRTAIRRRQLSAPMQVLMQHGYLSGGLSVFDYGCGHGDDLRILRERGISAGGWDPHFSPGEALAESDVVNLGFVINVIEDDAERRLALERAYALSRRVLAVAALIGGRTAYERRRLYRDGVISSRDTFQKYYSQQELREFIQTTVGREPIAVAPGIFLVFRGDDDEQTFLALRQSRRPQRVARVSISRKNPPTPSKWNEHAALADDFWRACIERGRLPASDEYSRLDEVRRALGAPARVLRHLCVVRGEANLADARSSRADDLSVFLALNVFERRRSFRALPEVLRRDIQAFWGTLQEAKSAATDLLFSIAKPGAVLAACRSAHGSGIGCLDGDHNLQLHTSIISQLPPLLRVYVACGSRLYGDVATADIVKIHITSGKLSLLTYDDFAAATPRLLERVKIDMRAQAVHFFDYDDSRPPEYLDAEGKERLLRGAEGVSDTGGTSDDAADP